LKSDMDVVTIIPARGGSKGIPRKNVTPLCGKPLIAWTIEAARNAKCTQRIFVSTDDQEIASLSKQFEAGVIPRPAELSCDTASSESALLHALEYLNENENYRPELLIFLQCTSPLTLPEDIDATVQALIAEQADSAMTVTPFHSFIWQQDETGNMVGVNHDKSTRPRRQDRKSQYRETGAVYVMRTNGFKQFKHRFFGKTVIHVVSEDRAFEIDEPTDLCVVETFLRDRIRLCKTKSMPKKISAVVFDFDGVFTDNRVFTTQDGTEFVACNRSDGWAIAQLNRVGLPLLVLSTESNPVVQARCRKLGLECICGATDKRLLLDNWLAARGIPWREIIYVGNDVNDLSCMRAAGCSVAVQDAYPEVKFAADVVLETFGGYGAVREIANLVLKRLEELK
jgi:YrbI family 3-deoxy-D-manno-octulosonate 8-phosphate phosphatase